MRTALIVPAAGSGERLGAGMPKALLELDGTPLLVHAVSNAWASQTIDVVVIAAPSGQQTKVGALLAGVVPPRADGPGDDADTFHVVAGGRSRRASVSAALAVLPDDVDAVLVHDAARCLTPPEVFVAVAKALAAGADAVVPVLPVADTIKEVDGDVVVETPDRAALRIVQTPQGFSREILERAHAGTSGDLTDDAGMVERLGYQVRTVDGDPQAFKITQPLDVLLAEAVLSHRKRRQP